jgi:hypothetical protein
MVELEYAGYFETTVTQTFEEVRMVVFRDSQPEGALPTAAELLCAASARSCFNPDLVGNQDLPRFKILANHYLTYNNVTPYTTGSNFTSTPLAGRIKLDFTSTYVGNAGTYADIQTNGLYVLFYAGNSSTTYALFDFCLKYLKM